MGLHLEKEILLVSIKLSLIPQSEEKCPKVNQTWSFENISGLSQYRDEKRLVKLEPEEPSPGPRSGLLSPFYKMRTKGLGYRSVGRVLVCHAWSSGFKPQHCIKRGRIVLSGYRSKRIRSSRLSSASQGVETSPGYVRHSQKLKVKTKLNETNITSTSTKLIFPV